MQRIRARRDLAEIAEAMRGRRREPREILAALARQAQLWRESGADLPAGAALTALRQLPGLTGYDALADWRERWANIDPEAEGIDADGDGERREQARRALVLSDWLRDHAGTASAEAAVRAVERDICDNMGGK